VVLYASRRNPIGNKLEVKRPARIPFERAEELHNSAHLSATNVQNITPIYDLEEREKGSFLGFSFGGYKPEQIFVRGQGLIFCVKGRETLSS